MKTFLIDCDGVIIDFHSMVREYVLERWDIEINTSDTLNWDILDHPLVKQYREEIWKYIIYTPSIIKNLKKFNYTDEMLSKLRERGKLLACTSSIFSGTFPGERVDWLIKEAGFNRHDIIFAHKKHLVMADVLIDDKPDNVDSWGVQMAKCNFNKALPVLWKSPNGPLLQSKCGYFRTGSVDELIKEIDLRT